MKSASLKEIKTELVIYPKANLEALCIRLAKYKKENKELLSYLLFEASDEEGYISKKTIRKVLRTTQKYIKYSGLKRTEVELLIYYCQKLINSGVAVEKSKAMENLYQRQLDKINKALLSLHEDLQYDYQIEIDNLLL